MWRISDEYHGTNLCRPVTVDDLARYRYLLRKHLQADCNRVRDIPGSGLPGGGTGA